MPAISGTPWLVGSSRRFVATLTAPADASSLAAFRILFGAVMAAAMVRFLAFGWVDEFYVRPAFHFTWACCPSVRSLPSPWMHAHFAVLAALALAIAAGFRLRLAAALFCAGFTYVELIDKTTYLNHYYLVSLLSGLLAVVPAARVWSIDAWRKPAAGARVPAWTVYLLRFQLAVVYFFAGLAKLNSDWLLGAQPLRMWLAARSDLPGVGFLLADIRAAYVFSWLGAAYDLGIVFLLLTRRTRAAAYAAVVVFHVMTAALFPIGIFPWVMIAATLVFFPPNWPRRWLPLPATDHSPAIGFRLAPWSAALLAVYATIQIAVPLRSYWPGTDAAWTGNGFNFSWRVMLAEKSGVVELTAVEPATGRRRQVHNRDYITERQEKMMAQDPAMIRSLAQHVAETLATAGRRPEIHADAFMSLNGQPAQRLIDPGVDLAGPPAPGWILRRSPAVFASAAGQLDSSLPSKRTDDGR